MKGIERPWHQFRRRLEMGNSKAGSEPPPGGHLRRLFVYDAELARSCWFSANGERRWRRGSRSLALRVIRALFAAKM